MCMGSQFVRAVWSLQYFFLGGGGVRCFGGIVLLGGGSTFGGLVVIFRGVVFLWQLKGSSWGGG